ncbi:MAG: hypothetical protein IKA56_03340 [Clostridia bacterium]|nr:hypothetical protein [Clostridia bacterium]
MKKVIVILLAIVICFTFGACGENNADTPDEENNAINNNNSKWYLKKEEKTFLDVEGTGSFVKTAYEYNLNENLICEKTFKEINNEFVQTLSKDFNYDDEGMINSMRICDEKNEMVHITLRTVEKYARDAGLRTFKRASRESRPIAGNHLTADNIGMRGKIQHDDIALPLSADAKHLNRFIRCSERRIYIRIVHTGIGADGSILHPVSAHERNPLRLGSAVCQTRRHPDHRRRG